MSSVIGISSLRVLSPVLRTSALIAFRNGPIAVGLRAYSSIDNMDTAHKLELDFERLRLQSQHDNKIFQCSFIAGMDSKLAATTVETNKQMSDIRVDVSNEIRSLRSDIAINYARLLSQISANEARTAWRQNAGL